MHAEACLSTPPGCSRGGIFVRQRARLDRLSCRFLVARNVPDAECGEEQLHAGLALGHKRIIGASALGDDDMLKRSTVALEQAGDGGEQTDRNEG